MSLSFTEPLHEQSNGATPVLQFAQRYAIGQFQSIDEVERTILQDISTLESDQQQAMREALPQSRLALGERFGVLFEPTSQSPKTRQQLSKTLASFVQYLADNPQQKGDTMTNLRAFVQAHPEQFSTYTSIDGALLQLQPMVAEEYRDKAKRAPILPNTPEWTARIGKIRDEMGAFFAKEGGSFASHSEAMQAFYASERGQKLLRRIQPADRPAMTNEIATLNRNYRTHKLQEYQQALAQVTPDTLQSEIDSGQLNSSSTPEDIGRAALAHLSQDAKNAFQWFNKTDDNRFQEAAIAYQQHLVESLKSKLELRESIHRSAFESEVLNYSVDRLVPTPTSRAELVALRKSQQPQIAELLATKWATNSGLSNQLRASLQQQNDQLWAQVQQREQALDANLGREIESLFTDWSLEQVPGGLSSAEDIPMTAADYTQKFFATRQAQDYLRLHPQATEQLRYAAQQRHKSMLKQFEQLIPLSERALSNAAKKLLNQPEMNKQEFSRALLRDPLVAQFYRQHGDFLHYRPLSDLVYNRLHPDYLTSRQEQLSTYSNEITKTLKSTDYSHLETFPASPQQLLAISLPHNPLLQQAIANQPQLRIAALERAAAELNQLTVQYQQALHETRKRIITLRTSRNISTDRERYVQQMMIQLQPQLGRFPIQAKSTVESLVLASYSETNEQTATIPRNLNTPDLTTEFKDYAAFSDQMMNLNPVLASGSPRDREQALQKSYREWLDTRDQLVSDLVGEVLAGIHIDRGESHSDIIKKILTNSLLLRKLSIATPDLMSSTRVRDRITLALKRSTGAVIATTLNDTQNSTQRQEHLREAKTQLQKQSAKPRIYQQGEFFNHLQVNNRADQAALTQIVSDIVQVRRKMSNKQQPIDVQWLRSNHHQIYSQAMEFFNDHGGNALNRLQMLCAELNKIDGYFPVWGYSMLALNSTLSQTPDQPTPTINDAKSDQPRPQRDQPKPDQTPDIVADTIEEETPPQLDADTAAEPKQAVADILSNTDQIRDKTAESADDSNPITETEPSPNPSPDTLQRVFGGSDSAELPTSQIDPADHEDRKDNEQVEPVARTDSKTSDDNPADGQLDQSAPQATDNPMAVTEVVSTVDENDTFIGISQHPSDTEQMRAAAPDIDESNRTTGIENKHQLTADNLDTPDQPDDTMENSAGIQSLNASDTRPENEDKRASEPSPDLSAEPVIPAPESITTTQQVADLTDVDHPDQRSAADNAPSIRDQAPDYVDEANTPETDKPKTDNNHEQATQRDDPDRAEKAVDTTESSQIDTINTITGTESLDLDTVQATDTIQTVEGNPSEESPLTRENNTVADTSDLKDPPLTDEIPTITPDISETTDNTDTPAPINDDVDTTVDQSALPDAVTNHLSDDSSSAVPEVDSTSGEAGNDLSSIESLDGAEPEAEPMSQSQLTVEFNEPTAKPVTPEDSTLPIVDAFTGNPESQDSPTAVQETTGILLDEADQSSDNKADHDSSEITADAFDKVDDVLGKIDNAIENSADDHEADLDERVESGDNLPAESQLQETTPSVDKDTTPPSEQPADILEAIDESVSNDATAEVPANEPESATQPETDTVELPASEDTVPDAPGIDLDRSGEHDKSPDDQLFQESHDTLMSPAHTQGDQLDATDDSAEVQTNKPDDQSAKSAPEVLANKPQELPDTDSDTLRVDLDLPGEGEDILSTATITQQPRPDTEQAVDIHDSVDDTLGNEAVALEQTPDQALPSAELEPQESDDAAVDNPMIDVDALESDTKAQSEHETEIINNDEDGVDTLATEDSTDTTADSPRPKAKPEAVTQHELDRDTLEKYAPDEITPENLVSKIDTPLESENDQLVDPQVELGVQTPSEPDQAADIVDPTQETADNDDQEVNDQIIDDASGSVDNLQTQPQPQPLSEAATPEHPTSDEVALENSGDIDTALETDDNSVIEPQPPAPLTHEYTPDTEDTSDEDVNTLEETDDHLLDEAQPEQQDISADHGESQVSQRETEDISDTDTTHEIPDETVDEAEPTDTPAAHIDNAPEATDIDTENGDTDSIPDVPQASAVELSDITAEDLSPGEQSADVLMDDDQTLHELHRDEAESPRLSEDVTAVEGDTATSADEEAQGIDLTTLSPQPMVESPTADDIDPLQSDNDLDAESGAMNAELSLDTDEDLSPEEQGELNVSVADSPDHNLPTSDSISPAQDTGADEQPSIQQDTLLLSETDNDTLADDTIPAQQAAADSINQRDTIPVSETHERPDSSADETSAEDGELAPSTPESETSPPALDVQPPPETDTNTPNDDRAEIEQQAPNTAEYDTERDLYDNPDFQSTDQALVEPTSEIEASSVDDAPSVEPDDKPELKATATLDRTDITDQGENQPADNQQPESPLDQAPSTELPMTESLNHSTLGDNTPDTLVDTLPITADLESEPVIDNADEQQSPELTASDGLTHTLADDNEPETLADTIDGDVAHEDADIEQIPAAPLTPSSAPDAALDDQSTNADMTTTENKRVNRDSGDHDNMSSALDDNDQSADEMIPTADTPEDQQTERLPTHEPRTGSINDTPSTSPDIEQQPIDHTDFKNIPLEPITPATQPDRDSILDNRSIAQLETQPELNTSATRDTVDDNTRVADNIRASTPEEPVVFENSAAQTTPELQSRERFDTLDIQPSADKSPVRESDAESVEPDAETASPLDLSDREMPRPELDALNVDVPQDIDLNEQPQTVLEQQSPAPTALERPAAIDLELDPEDDVLFDTGESVSHRRALLESESDTDLTDTPPQRLSDKEPSLDQLDTPVSAVPDEAIDLSPAPDTVRSDDLSHLTDEVVATETDDGTLDVPPSDDIEGESVEQPADHNPDTQTHDEHGETDDTSSTTESVEPLSTPKSDNDANTDKIPDNLVQPITDDLNTPDDDADQPQTHNTDDLIDARETESSDGTAMDESPSEPVQINDTPVSDSAETQSPPPDVDTSEVADRSTHITPNTEPALTESADLTEQSFTAPEDEDLVSEIAPSQIKQADQPASAPATPLESAQTDANIEPNTSSLGLSGEDPNTPEIIDDEEFAAIVRAQQLHKDSPSLEWEDIEDSDDTDIETTDYVVTNHTTDTLHEAIDETELPPTPDFTTAQTLDLEPQPEPEPSTEIPPITQQSPTESITPQPEEPATNNSPISTEQAEPPAPEQPALDDKTEDITPTPQTPTADIPVDTERDLPAANTATDTLEERLDTPPLTTATMPNTPITQTQRVEVAPPTDRLAYAADPQPLTTNNQAPQPTTPEQAAAENTETALASKQYQIRDLPHLLQLRNQDVFAIDKDVAAERVVVTNEQLKRARQHIRASQSVILETQKDLTRGIFYVVDTASRKIIMQVYLPSFAENLS